MSAWSINSVCPAMTLPISVRPCFNNCTVAANILGRGLVANGSGRCVALGSVGAGRGFLRESVCSRLGSNGFLDLSARDVTVFALESCLFVLSVRCSRRAALTSVQRLPAVSNL